MTKIRAKNSAAVLVFMCIACLNIDSASAHRVNVFAWVEGDTIYVESKFAGGKKVKSGKIIVLDPQGGELHAGRTNDRGEFSFKVPKRTDLRIVLIAGEGHQGEWTIHAAELKDLPSKTASDTSVENAMQSEQKKSASRSSVDTMTAAPHTAIKPEDLEAIIETVLDKKLKPITRVLADIRQEGPTVRDIFAGIGYILGLVGIAAYVQSRKKKE